LKVINIVDQSKYISPVYCENSNATP